MVIHGNPVNKIFIFFYQVSLVISVHIKFLLLQVFQVSDQHLFFFHNRRGNYKIYKVDRGTLQRKSRFRQGSNIWGWFTMHVMSTSLRSQELEMSRRKQSIFTYHAHPVVCCQVWCPCKIRKGMHYISYPKETCNFKVFPIWVWGPSHLNHYKTNENHIIHKGNWFLSISFYCPEKTCILKRLSVFPFHVVLFSYG